MKLTAVGLSSGSLLSLLPANGTAQVVQASGTTLGKLDENDPQAAALGYKHDASQVDTKKFKVRGTLEGADQFCHNCQLYTGLPGEQWGPCAIFSYRTDTKTGRPLAVSANGWCVAWGPRAGYVPPAPPQRVFETE